MCLTIKTFTQDEITLIRDLERKKKRFMYLIKEKSKIAEEDVKVYKVLTWNLVRDNIVWNSPYFSQRYIFEKEYKAKFKFNVRRNAIGISVENGLHSYSSVSAATTCSRGYQLRREIFEATVPKGTKYIVGNNCDIVSERLVVHSTKIK